MNGNEILYHMLHPFRSSCVYSPGHKLDLVAQDREGGHDCDYDKQILSVITFITNIQLRSNNSWQFPVIFRRHDSKYPHLKLSSLIWFKSSLVSSNPLSWKSRQLYYLCQVGDIHSVCKRCQNVATKKWKFTIEKLLITTCVFLNTHCQLLYEGQDMKQNYIYLIDNVRLKKILLSFALQTKDNYRHISIMSNLYTMSVTFYLKKYHLLIS